MKRNLSGKTNLPRSLRGLSDPALVLTTAIIVLLFVQFLTGTWLSLFATFSGTSNSTLSAAMDVMMSGSMPATHLAVGVLLSVLSIVELAVLWDSGQSGPAKFAAGGLASIVLAGISGTAFAYSGFQSGVYSYLMAVAFISAFASYFVVILSSRAK
jgi:hypothetical protein